VRVIREGAGTQFCPNVVRNFRAVVMPYPVGHEITLPDGRAAVVSFVDPESPEVPSVRVLGTSGIEEFAIDMAAPAPEPAVA
jgi:HD-GYP domain-containing protein (c-di-GMP phosphodiesterase class II)